MGIQSGNHIKQNNIMQKRHQDPKIHFQELVNHSQGFLIDDVSDFISLTKETHVLKNELKKPLFF